MWQIHSYHYERKYFETVWIRRWRGGQRNFMPDGPYYLGEGRGLVVFSM